MIDQINIFEAASRGKVRFEYKGFLSVEDLWDLSVEELDRIFQRLNGKLKATKDEESLLTSKKKSGDSSLELKVAIVRRIVEVKLTEQADREALIAKKEKRQKILGILAERQDESLKGMSVEDLNKMLDEL
jgi:hypothetical protein